MMLQRFSSATIVSPDKSSCMGIVSELTTSQSSSVDGLICVSFAGIRFEIRINHPGSRPSTAMRVAIPNVGVVFPNVRFGTLPTVCSSVVFVTERDDNSQRL
jgi:hypothetical protein